MCLYEEDGESADTPSSKTKFPKAKYKKKIRKSMRNDARKISNLKKHKANPKNLVKKKRCSEKIFVVFLMTNFCNT